MLTSFFKKLTGGKFYFLMVTIFSSFYINSDAQEIEWQNTIGGTGIDQYLNIVQTTDGGFMLGGSSSSNISGDKTENCIGQDDYWIVKIDSTGNIQWQNTIGGTYSDLFADIIPTSDGGYLLGGRSQSNISTDKTENCLGNFDYWIVKTDATGNIQWDNTIGGSDAELLERIIQTSDGGYLLGGSSQSNISGDKTENCIGGYDIWLVKIDGNGAIQWQNTIGGSNGDEVASLQQTTDGGYILGVVSSSGISGDKTENSNGGWDYWIVKTDVTGNIQWQNTIGGSNDDILSSVQQTTDGGYIIGGSSQSNVSGDKTENSLGGKDYWILKTDASGNIIWQNTIGGSGWDELKALDQTNGGGYILGGNSSSTFSVDKSEHSNIGYFDYWVVKTDSAGVIQWDNTIIGNYSDQLTDIIQTTDGGYMVGGNSASGISGDKTEAAFGSNQDFWILKLNGYYNNITGTSFLDLNSNNTMDGSEPVLKNRKIAEQNTGRVTFTQQNGFYNLSVLDSGSYFVTMPTTLTNFTVVPLMNSAIFITTQQTDSSNEFAWQPTSVFNDLCLTLTPLSPFRSGFHASYMINYENVGTTSLNGTVKIYPDNVLSYVSSSQTPVSVNADSVVWNVGTLAPFEAGTVLVTFLVSSSAPIGSVTNSVAQVEPIINDANPTCNIDTATVTITGSFDPNDILVSEDTLLTSQLPTASWLDYTIRFQNTGNDTAFTVKIINPIDTNRLNLQTIELLNSSHPVQLKWVNYNRNMEFLLENILLPDSGVNEPQSHGFVNYRIKPKTSLLAGDSVTNKAYIYFDFNAPIETNTATTKIILPTSINELAKGNGPLTIFPNPVDDELNIKLNYPNYPNPSITISIFDVLGNVVLSKQSATANSKLPIANFSKGIYFAEVKTVKEVYMAKFIKL